MSARLILMLHRIASWIDGFTDRPHLTTDPTCVHHRAPRPGSRLDRASRGVACTPCMSARAWSGVTFSGDMSELIDLAHDLFDAEATNHQDVSER